MYSENVCLVKLFYKPEQIYSMTRKLAGSLFCKIYSGIYLDDAKYTTVLSKIGMIDVEMQ